MCDSNDIKTYVEVLSFLQNLNIGVKIDNQDTDEIHLTLFVRAQECLRVNFEGKVPSEEWADLKKMLEALKKTDPRNINKGGVIEVDEFIELVLNQYNRLETVAAEKVHDLFIASDFGNTQLMSVD